MPNFGNLYQPGSDDVQMSGGGPAPGIAPQGPAKILSLRLPRNLGQSPTVARDLLTAPGAGGSPDLNALIMMLLRSAQPPMTPQGLMAPRQAQGAPQQFHAAQGAQGLAPLQGAGTAFPQAQGGIPAPRFGIGEEPNPQGQRG